MRVTLSAIPMPPTKPRPERCRPPKPSLKDRPLLTRVQAGGLAALFRVLANDTRLRLIHALVRSDELPSTELAATVGMKPPAVSNQLKRLSEVGIVASRRDGNSVIYRLIDPCALTLLDQGLCVTEDENERTTRHGRSGR